MVDCRVKTRNLAISRRAARCAHEVTTDSKFPTRVYERHVTLRVRPAAAISWDEFFAGKETYLTRLMADEVDLTENREIYIHHL